MKASVMLILLVSLTTPLSHSTALAADTPSAGSAVYALPSAESGVSYEYQLSPQGGVPPFKWRIAGGELPSGIILDQSGSFRGIATNPRREPFEVLVELSDSSQPPQVATMGFELLVKPAQLRIVPQSPNKLGIATGNPPTAPMPFTVGRARTSSNLANPNAGAAASSSGSSLVRPVLTGHLRAGDTAIKGFVPPTAESIKVIVTEKIDLPDKSYRESIAASKLVTTVDRITGEFSVTMPPLKKGQAVHIEADAIQGGAKTVLISAVAAVEEALKPLPPRLIEPLLEGARTVSGFVEGKVTRVKVKIFNGATATEKSGETEMGLADIAETADISDTGEFEVTLKRPLVVGQTVQARAFDGDNPGELSLKPPTVESAGDWGRVRATFAAGVVFSKEKDDFSKQTPYFEFGLDYNWFRRGPNYPKPVPRVSNSEAPDRSDEPLRYWKENTAAAPVAKRAHNTNVLLNTFLQTRLTAIASDENPSCSSNDILCSKKAALVQAGVYAPMFRNDFMTWSHGGNRNALFIAPIFKGGIQTTTEENDPHLMGFYAGGLRVGHFNVGPWNETGTFARDNTPRMLSYLDLTLGQWQNFEANGVRRLRAGFEGRLKVPVLPLQIGFDANVGSGPDDLRFVIDTAFDIGDLFKKIFPPKS